MVFRDDSIFAIIVVLQHISGTVIQFILFEWRQINKQIEQLLIYLLNRNEKRTDLEYRRKTKNIWQFYYEPKQISLRLFFFHNFCLDFYCVYHPMREGESNGYWERVASPSCRHFFRRTQSHRKQTALPTTLTLRIQKQQRCLFVFLILLFNMVMVKLVPHKFPIDKSSFL